jgi:4-oxalocrotonate tautomerase family enzyme
MPMIIVEGPLIKEIERKRQLVKELTDVAARIYGIKHITIIIRENSPENVGADGELIIDKHKAQ